MRLAAHLLLSGLSLLVARDAPAQPLATQGEAVDTPLEATARAPRIVAWAEGLQPVPVTCQGTGETVPIRLYTREGEIDDAARFRLEGVVAGDGAQHPLEARLEQLLVKAAYHFHGAQVVVVSGWRSHAGRHSTGEALDFRLKGVSAAALASYLRGLPRVGVGIYTHPRTQYVHLDVREPSYHWLDGSPPGITWKERQLRDPGQVKRDASWTPEGDLPL